MVVAVAAFVVGVVVVRSGCVSALDGGVGGCWGSKCEEEEEEVEALFIPNGDDVDGRRETAVGLRDRFCGETGA